MNAKRKKILSEEKENTFLCFIDNRITEIEIGKVRNTNLHIFGSSISATVLPVAFSFLDKLAAQKQL